MNYIWTLDTTSRLDLRGGEILFQLKRDEVMDAYNGIGNDSMPAPIRWGLTKLNPPFVIPSIIHDCWWSYYSNGTAEDFLKSNEDFYENCLICTRDSYTWYNPMRYTYMLKAKSFHKLLDEFGWSAYLEAYQKRNA